jgi:hypothetical protein
MQATKLAEGNKVMTEPIIISRSEKSLFKSCRLARHLQYKEGLVPKKDKPVLVVGNVAHKFLEELYTGTRRDARERAVAAFDEYMDRVLQQASTLDLEDEDYEKLQIDTKKMRVLCDEYCLYHWENDKKEFKFLEAEWDVHVPVTHPTTGELLLAPDGREVHLGARFDQVWESKKTGKIQIVENKTAATFDEASILLDIGDQVSDYFHIGTVLPEWQGRLGHLIWNVIVKSTKSVTKADRKKYGEDAAGSFLTRYRKEIAGNRKTIFPRRKLKRTREDLKQIMEENFLVCRDMVNDPIIYRECQWKCSVKELCVRDTPDARATFFDVVPGGRRDKLERKNA